jgi:LmbE family N-acetylglucosaminyl deacetylase
MAFTATNLPIPESKLAQPPTGLTGLRGTLRRMFTHRARKVRDDELACSAVVFAPHQDDETLGSGGTILRKRAAGADVTIVFMTDGRRSHADHMSVEKLVAQRHDEGVAAAESLGVSASDVLSLGFEDGRLRDHADAAREQVDQILRERDPAEVYVTYARDGVADHVAACAIVNTSVASVCPHVVVHEYPIWYWAYWPFARRSDFANWGLAVVVRHAARCIAALRREQLVRVPIGEVRAGKWDALMLHATQMQRPEGQDDWLTLGDVWGGGFLDCFFDECELFIRRPGAG